MRLVRLSLALVLASSLATFSACASGDETSGAAPPPVEPSRILEAGSDDDASLQEDATAPKTGCSADGFCYVPVPSSTPLIAVSASSADDAWMLAQQSRVLLHWNGAAIEQLYEYDGANAPSTAFVALWAAQKDDVWAAASIEERGLFLVHYAKRSGNAAPSFRELPTSIATGATRALWGTPTSDALWVAMGDTILRVREDASGAVIEDLRPTASPADEQGYAWSGVWGFAADDVFAAGKVCPSAPCDADSQGVIAHYDGTSWSITTLESTFELSSLRGTPPGTTRQLWYDATEELAGTFVSKIRLVGIEPGGQLGAELYSHVTNAPPACGGRVGQAVSASVGWFSSGNLLCRWNGTELAPARTALGDRPMFNALNGIWAGADDVWLVGTSVTRKGLPPGPVAARRTTTMNDGGRP
jgi:hypothetical protein